MDFKNIHESKNVRNIILGLSIFILALGIFKVGEVVGYHKARFAKNFGDNYRNNFMDSKKGFFRSEVSDRMPPGGHGAVGKIIGTASSTLIVADKDNLEKIVVIKDDTSIREYQSELKVTDLKIGDFIIVLGTSNEKGEIEAKLIRVTPLLQEGTSTPMMMLNSSNK